MPTTKRRRDKSNLQFSPSPLPASLSPFMYKRASLLSFVLLRSSALVLPAGMYAQGYNLHPQNHASNWPRRSRSLIKSEHHALRYNQGRYRPRYGPCIAQHQHTRADHESSAWWQLFVLRMYYIIFFNEARKVPGSTKNPRGSRVTHNTTRVCSQVTNTALSSREIWRRARRVR